VRTIVAVYDEHESAGRALERAAELARALSCHLVVLSLAPPVEPPPSVEELQPSFDSVRGETARLAENPLALSPQPPPEAEPVDRVAEHAERARGIVARAGADAEIVAVDGDGNAVLELAAERRADLLVVGAHRPSVWQRLVGSSSEGHVASRAECDVLVVR
jgi:nucleotide-binding universal stress UspA family protein